VAITASSAASSAAALFRSVIRWLQVGYPEGVPGPDRVALLALLRNTPLTEDQIEEVVDAIDEESDDGTIGRNVIADFISDTTPSDAGPENIARVSSRLAAAGWPLAGIADFPGAGTSADTSNGVAATSETASQA
jgi:hypothetical protein